MDTFSIEICKATEVYPEGVMTNEYGVLPWQVMPTIDKLLGEVSVIDFVQGINIQVRKEKGAKTL